MSYQLRQQRVWPFNTVARYLWQFSSILEDIKQLTVVIPIRDMQMRTLLKPLGLFLLGLVGSFLVVAAASDPLGIEDVVGVWRMCYEPTFSGEVDVGYILFTPAGRAVAITHPCCDQGKIVRSGKFEVIGNDVHVLWDSKRGIDGQDLGKSSRWTLHYLGEIVVVFWRDKNDPTARPVLSSSKSANYGYAKVF